MIITAATSPTVTGYTNTINNLNSTRDLQENSLKLRSLEGYFSFIFTEIIAPTKVGVVGAVPPSLILQVYRELQKVIF